jgi:cell division transport system permease protein
LTGVLTQVQDKVDINVYYAVDAQEETLLSFKTQVENLPEVKSVEYINRETALLLFQEENKDDEVVIQVLDEINGNPLGAYFNIQAKDPRQYQGIVSFIDSQSESGPMANLIRKHTYTDSEQIIARLTKIVDGTRTVSFVISIVMIIMSILVTLTTIRLTIYISKDEINVMKLVGANPGFIRGPFIFAGVMYGAISAILTLLIIYFSTLWLSQKTDGYLGGIDLFSYYTSNFGQMFVVIMAAGILLGVVSSFIAVRRHLN